MADNTQQKAPNSMLAWIISFVLTVLAYFAILQFWRPDSLLARILIILVLSYGFRYLVDNTLPRKTN
ncbi:MAG: hypothetical protein AAF798_19775 [Bacteroidota bacterium]